MVFKDEKKNSDFNKQILSFKGQVSRSSELVIIIRKTT